MTGKNGRKATLKKVPEKVTENQRIIIESMKQNPTAQERIKKTTRKTTQKMISFLRGFPDATRKDIAKEAGITKDGVKYHLDKLQKRD